MRNEGELVLAVGYQSLVGPRSENQDFAAVYFGSPIEQSRHGTIAAIADGVSGGKEGGTASELAVRSLIEGYYSIPHTLGAARAMQVPLTAFNRWLHAMGQSDTMRNSATTFTAFALRGRHGHLVHVGDSRAWRFSGDRLTRLTTDHTRSEPDLQHVLIRAVGIEAELRLDHANIELAEHDRLLLTTDGIHGTLSDRKIAAIMARGASAKATAAELADEALKAGGNDNA
ncbi:MAG: protein phosphatase 2C domain-containing protein, partial [Sphingomonadaceae bacterium]|nr:protein phosphatase 2C domain-containing protein [Sphingomonadaceae bacterium]